MFSLNESLHYYLYPYYINIGCGIEILSELVRNTKDKKPTQREMSICSVVKNRRHDQTVALAGRRIYFISEAFRGRRTFELPVLIPVRTGIRSNGKRS